MPIILWVIFISSVVQISLTDLYNLFYPSAIFLFFYHRNSQEELSWGFYQGTLKPTYAKSESEEIRDVVVCTISNFNFFFHPQILIPSLLIFRIEKKMKSEDSEQPNKLLEELVAITQSLCLLMQVQMTKSVPLFLELIILWNW